MFLSIEFDCERIATMKKELKKTLQYYQFFNYAPSLDELFLFHPSQIAQKRLIEAIRSGKRTGFLKEWLLKSTPRYTLGEYTIVPQVHARLAHQAEQKKKSITDYLSVLRHFPQIQMVGLTGSVSMGQAAKNDDIDLCIISSRRRVWTARFIAVVLAALMGIRRKRLDGETRDKVCLNLFFDENDLCIPAAKRTEYIAHEALQMKPLIDKKSTYFLFISKNKWIFDFFPNAKAVYDKKIPVPYTKGLFISEILEIALKKIQLYIISRHRTNELVNENQMWFFPDDFEKKLKISV